MVYLSPIMVYFILLWSIIIFLDLFFAHFLVIWSSTVFFDRFWEILISFWPSAEFQSIFNVSRQIKISSESKQNKNSTILHSLLTAKKAN